MKIIDSISLTLRVSISDNTQMKFLEVNNGYI